MNIRTCKEKLKNNNTKNIANLEFYGNLGKISEAIINIGIFF